MKNYRSRYMRDAEEDAYPYIEEYAFDYAYDASESLEELSEKLHRVSIKLKGIENDDKPKVFASRMKREVEYVQEQLLIIGQGLDKIIDELKR